VPARGLLFSCICLLGGAFLMWMVPIWWSLHPGDHGVGDSVHVRLVADPAVVHRLPPPAGGAACRIPLQDARRRGHVRGLPGLLRRHPGAADAGSRHPPGADRHARVVCAAGRGLPVPAQAPAGRCRVEPAARWPPRRSPERLRVRFPSRPLRGPFLRRSLPAAMHNAQRTAGAAGGNGRCCPVAPGL
jgi:hypothetical protein